MKFGENSYRFRPQSAKKNKGSWLIPLFLGGSFLFGCSGDLGRKYSQDPVAVGAFGKLQEDSLTSLLQKYVDSNSRVNYSAWRASSSDVAALKNVLAAIASQDTRALTSPEAKAFYINAYNAMTIDLILSHYDGTLGRASSPYPNDRSIRNIDNLDDAVWDRFTWKVGGQSRSLNDVENKILRPMGDARIHFSIVCASKGCPPLLNRAFSGGSVDQLLDQLADAFANSGVNTQFNSDTNQIKTSHILDWFSSDFSTTFGSVKGFFLRYVKVIPTDQVQGMRVSFVPYDWTLNEQTAATTQVPNAIPTPGLGSGTETPPGSGTETQPPSGN